MVVNWSEIVRSVKTSIGQRTPAFWDSTSLVSTYESVHVRMCVNVFTQVACTAQRFWSNSLGLSQVFGPRVRTAPTSTLWWDPTTGVWLPWQTTSAKFICLPTHAPNPRWVSVQFDTWNKPKEHVLGKMGIFYHHLWLWYKCILKL